MDQYELSCHIGVAGCEKSADEQLDECPSLCVRYIAVRLCSLDYIRYNLKILRQEIGTFACCADGADGRVPITVRTIY
jgi:predicted naringenin-chalcone synthase